MSQFIFLTLCLTVAFGLFAIFRYRTGFQSQKPSEYADSLPTFDLRRDLNGAMRCEGMIFGPTGRVTSRFEADMEITWDGPTGVMSEAFRYDDGTQQDRAWHLTIAEDGTIRAEASDVIGAGRGQIGGNALGLRYRIRLPQENGGHVLDAVDWMYLQDGGVILNRSQFRKYGIKVAELFCTIRPKENDDA